MLVRSLFVAAALSPWAAATPAAVTLAEAGQGTAAEDARLDELRFGTYWYGAPIGHEDLIGKVVLVELWGS